MGNYLKMIDVKRIQALLSLGWSYRRIQRETGIRRETIARYDNRRRSNAAKAPAGEMAKPAKVPTGSVEPYRQEIEAALAKGLSAQRIWQDLREEYGFGFGYDSVKRFVRKLKKRRPEVADVLEHLPGKEAQVDFFQGPPVLDPGKGIWRRPWVFRMTLSCTRHGYEEAIWQQDLAHFIRAHEHAFEDFGGVTEVVRHDNLKAAIVRACLYDPDVSELYAAFAGHYGFVPLPARPRHPQEDGIAERSGGYVKDNALKGRRFNSLEELNSYLVRWNRTIARLRIHGTTRKQVYTHFLEVEKPRLRPLPPERFALFKVGTRTVHSRTYPGTYATQQEHRPAHKPAREEAYVAGLLGKAEHIGPNALNWAKAACEERGVRAYRLLQGMIALTRSLPKERVDWACRLALANRLFRYKILKRLAEKEPIHPVSTLIQKHEIIRELSEYAEEVKI